MARLSKQAETVLGAPMEQAVPEAGAPISNRLDVSSIFIRSSLRDNCGAHEVSRPTRPLTLNPQKQTKKTKGIFHFVTFCRNLFIRNP